MPTVLRVDGFSFTIYPGDHDPPHVHVWYAGAGAIVVIEEDLVRSVKGMKKPDIATALTLVRAHRDELLTAWAKTRSQGES
ncbi:MAG TPA: DUF4160 domain-containing protein [Longimicrobium sp.]|jgi:hypothetical protein|nr:DUF4160 domain-containing protein [Longimicrobium sp.]